MNITADVTVLGGGLEAFLAAYLLQKDGKQVVVLEAGDMGTQLSPTHSRLMNLMDLPFEDLEKQLGSTELRTYCEALHSALEVIERVVLAEEMDCGFKRVDGFLFLNDSTHGSVNFLRGQLEAAKRAGLLGVHYVDNVPSLPFKSGTAIKFPRQVQLDITKLLGELTSSFVQLGGTILTRAPISKIVKEEDRYTVCTVSGAEIHCSSLAVEESHFVSDFRGSRTIAGAVPKGTVPHGLYTEMPGPSRAVSCEVHPGNPNLDLLLIEGHSDAKLENWVKTRFPGLKVQLDTGLEAEFLKSNHRMDRDQLLTEAKRNGAQAAMDVATRLSTDLLQFPNTY